MTPQEKAAILALIRASKLLTDVGRPRPALACLRLAVSEMARRV